MRRWKRTGSVVLEDDPWDDDATERFVRVVGLPLDPETSSDAEDDDAAPDPAVRGSTGRPRPPAPPLASPEPPPTPPAPASARRSPALAAFDPGRRGVRAIAVVAALVVLIAGFLAWRSRPRPQPVPARVEATSAPNTSGSPAFVVVAVAGSVRHPGLVRLTTGSRVADAIDAAGGVLPGTDLAYLNLARKVTDGELVLVGVSPPPGVAGGASAAQASGAGSPVNLNTAGLAELQTLPGVGPVLAQRILDYRGRHGNFRSVNDLRQVQGIGATRFEQLKDLVTV